MVSAQTDVSHCQQVESKASLPPSLKESQSPGLTVSNKGPKLAVILLLGIDGAGKTTLLRTLQGEHNPRVRPSVGFKPVTMMLSDHLKVRTVLRLAGTSKLLGPSMFSQKLCCSLTPRRNTARVHDCELMMSMNPDNR